MSSLGLSRRLICLYPKISLSIIITIIALLIYKSWVVLLRLLHHQLMGLLIINLSSCLLILVCYSWCCWWWHTKNRKQIMFVLGYRYSNRTSCLSLLLSKSSSIALILNLIIFIILMFLAIRCCFIWIYSNSWLLKTIFIFF